MFSIIILYDLMAREYWMCNKLQNELIKHGHKVYLYQWNFEYYKALSAAKKEKISMIIIPSCYTNNDYERVVMPFKKYNDHTIFINMHNEQIGYVENNLKLIPSEELIKNTMYHISWGEYFTNILRNTGIRENLIIQTGHLRLLESILKSKHIPRNELASQYKLDTNKKWILFCDSGDSLHFELYKKGVKPSDSIGGSSISDEMQPFYAQNFIKILEIFNNLSEKIYNNYEVIYRPHPGVKEINKEIIGNKIHLIADCSIYTWFDHIEYNIVSRSTTIFESDAVGIKSLVLMPIPFKYRVLGIYDYTVIKDGEELESVLSLNKSINNNIYNKYIGSISKDSFNIFVKKIESILETDRNELISIRCSTNNKKKYSSLLANLLFWLFYLSGILKHIKWPLAFAMNKNEHPIYKIKYQD